MSDHEIKLDGQTWDLLALRSARSENWLPALLDRARVGERLGPSAMLGLAACSTTSSLADARHVLRSDFGFDSARAKGAVAIGGLISSATVTNDPFGFVAGVKMSPSQRNRVCGRLGGTPTADAVGDKLSLAAAMANWDSRKFRRFALDAARTNDPAVMGVSAAIGASLRRHDPQGFAAGLTASQTYPLASGRNTKLAQRANDVLTAAYTMSSLNPSGLALGTRAWNDAPPTWRESAAPWVYAILDETNGAAVAHLLDAVHSRRLNFAQPGSSPFHFLDSQQELTEARLRLRTFSGQLTKWFDRPMWFDGGPGQVQVLLTQDEDRYMYAWVGVNGVGLLVAFDLIDGVPYGPDVAGVRAALALAIGWYLDVSVSLRMSASGTPAVQRSAVGTVTTGARYVPLPSFVHHANSMNSGTKALPRLHGVVAHVRTFTNGYKPSARARQNAPKRLQAGMQSNQTFVRSYMKGHGNLALLTTHLSKYSALADVIAGLQRRSG